jgi:hypothetical protein
MQIYTIPYYKFKVSLTEICTGESKTLVYQAPFGLRNAMPIIEEVFKDSDYRIDSVKDITGVIKIPITPPCPN